MTRNAIQFVVMLAACSPLLAEKPRALVTFYAMGDVPYAPAEDQLLPKQVAKIPSDAEFVVHVGDIKRGTTPCDEAVFQKVSGMLAKSKAPLFIIPGDNEWNDCKSPAEAWKYWETYFSRFDRRWPHRLRVFRQLEREENFSFVQGGVLFLGINLVGGRVHDAAEWKTRMAQGVEWLQRNLAQFGESASSVVVFGHANPGKNQKPFIDGFVEQAGKFKKPMLYLHGDGHKWIHDRPFAAKNILRVQVDQGGIAPPLKVTITDDPAEPFVFDRRKPVKDKQP
ncbi:MAG: hypothetical protein O3A00_14210 [Planctomycetota bacterium]|nr:hypothetical protein [Planctomycetota bacterium]